LRFEVFALELTSRAVKLASFRAFMKNEKNILQWTWGSALVLLSAGLLAGCQADKSGASGDAKAAVATPAAAKPVAPVSAPAAAAAPAKVETAAATKPQIVRIKAGVASNFTDSEGNVWLADQGFEGGETIEREGDMQIANTKDPALYRTEHFSMTSFSYALPDGKYTVKLHFAETFEGIEGPGGRVFSFTVQGREFKDFDVWVKAGGPRKAYIETVPVEITGGKLEITFKANVENPEVNAIEIIPET
jgi:hypothetical protein